MATELFASMLETARDPSARSQQSNLWLREQATSVRTVQNPKQLVTQQSDRLVTALTVGRMYLFMYDPKMKDDLPYYDRFPLIFPFKRVNGGFYGINMHYLPHVLRAKLMDSLYTLSNNKNNDDSTKLKLSYNLLNNASKFRYFKP